MTDHQAPTHTAPTSAAPGVQEYPKMLYRDAPAHEADAPPEHVVVGDKTAEDRERQDGYVDAAEYEKKTHEKKDEKKAAKK